MKKTEIERIQKEIEARLISAGADLVGFADVSDLSLSLNARLRTAIAIGIAYDNEIVDRLDTEADTFETHLTDTRKRMERALGTCEGYIRENGFTTWTPPIAKNLPGLLGDFSHKMAATKAGLGWIGKSSLFVSPEIGCGIRLATILTDAGLEPGTPVTESRCGACVECVGACPYGAIEGENWHPGIERDRLLDAFLCSGKREEYIPELGYKHPCGLCLKACPIGKGKE